MTELLQLDQSLFYLINTELSNNFFDWLFPWWREKHTWLPFYILLSLFLVIKFKKKGAILLIATILTVSIADLTSSRVMKKTFERPRPCLALKESGKVIQRVGCSKSFSFTSSHATNHFALAVFLVLTLGTKYRRIKVPLLLWATSIAFAQVYVGVHYPFDVICGAILGTTIGFLGLFTLAKKFPNLLESRPAA